MDEQPPVPTQPVQPLTNPEPTAPPAPASPPPVSESLPSVPTTWPGAFGAYKFSKQAVKINLVTVVVLWIFTIIVEEILKWKLKVPGYIISDVIGSLITAGLALTYIAGVRKQQVSIGQALRSALPLWLKVIGLQILVIISIAASVILLIIPFFFVLPRLTLATYFLVDKKLGIIEAYKASWAVTKGYSVKVWGIIGVNLLMVVLALTIIGIPFSIYFLVMYSAAFAVLYEFIIKVRPATATQLQTTEPQLPSMPSIQDTPATVTPSPTTSSVPPDTFTTPTQTEPLVSPPTDPSPPTPTTPQATV